MNLKKSRKYNSKIRAESAAITELNILKAMVELWLEYSIHEITLEMIANKSGITVRTILRKFGSKEALYEAGIKHDIAGIQSIKDETPVGDIEQAVNSLMKEYELTGLAAIRTLAIEKEVPIASKILKKGRQYHKTWCARVFAPFLPEKSHKNYDVLLGTFYAATDVNNWKLLRIDLGYSKKNTELIFKITLESIIKSIPNYL